MHIWFPTRMTYWCSVSLARKIILSAGILLLISAGVFYWYYEQRIYRLDSLLARLPTSDSAVVHIDFASLRTSGALKWFTGSGAGEEPDYKNFVAKTGFDYKRDLDLALVSFHPSGTFFLIRGRFNWPRLEEYALGNKGTCYRSLCRLAGSKPDRRISFFPLRRDLMAMAVSADDFAASRLDSAPAHPGFPVVDHPIWIHLSPGALRDPERFPEGTRLFAKALEIAESTTLSVGAGAGQDLAARLVAECPDERSAQTLVETLERITTLLSTLIRRESHSPDPSELAGVLASGKFQREGRRALGTWKVSHAFIQKLTGTDKGAESGK
jgi:hypothetical protein